MNAQAHRTVSGSATPVPRMLTRMLTPSTRPTWRAMLTMPLPVADCAGGRLAVAAATRLGNPRPTPAPMTSHPGSKVVQ